jgi:transposase InsO family protein
MGRAGACGDNAAMESLCPAAKNVLDRKRWDIRMQLLLAITTWIERTYRRRRRQRRLGKANTCGYEMLYTTAALPA